MTEVIVRAAKAIVAKMAEPSPPSETPGEVALLLARASIDATREPSPAMMEAGLRALAKAGCGSPLPGWAAEDCWRAMIDAALSRCP